MSEWSVDESRLQANSDQGAAERGGIDNRYFGSPTRGHSSILVGGSTLGDSSDLTGVPLLRQALTRDTSHVMDRSMETARSSSTPLRPLHPERYPVSTPLRRNSSNPGSTSRAGAVSCWGRLGMIPALLICIRSSLILSARLCDGMMAVRAGGLMPRPDRGPDRLTSMDDHV
jgi:hypothetical protein